MNMIQEEKKITESILKGLEKNEFKMYLQFIVDNKTKKIVSAEALSRWDSPDKGLVGPGKYIGNMEITGLNSLNIKVICEGVETEVQNTLVSSSDCDFVQGWFYSKALPLEECESFTDRY